MSTPTWTNQRSSIGLPPVYEGAQHRLPWMSEQVLIRKEKNFFETHPTEYRTGGALSWDDRALPPTDPRPPAALRRERGGDHPPPWIATATP